jgi:Icc-related predicted phosphoesterase
MSGTTKRTKRERGGGREVRVAAIGDLHFDGTRKGSLIELFSDINRKADVLALCGDMTTHGQPDEMQTFIDELAPIEIPIVAVLGNHDHESDRAPELTEMLRKRGVYVLDGEHVVLEGIGFAGAKGFVGGFDQGALAPFGEKLIKDFVHAALEESLKLERALRALHTEVKAVLMHYSPIKETLAGEPEAIYPFMGSSRLREPLDVYGASIVFHGHAHIGQREGRTPGGVPVFNVALPLLARNGESYPVWTVPLPDRRQRSA